MKLIFLWGKTGYSQIVNYIIISQVIGLLKEKQTTKQKKTKKNTGT